MDETTLAIGGLWLTLGGAYFAWPAVRSRVARPRKRDLGFIDYEETKLLNERVASATAALQSPMVPRRPALPEATAPNIAPVSRPARPSLSQPATSLETVPYPRNLPSVRDEQAPSEVAMLRAQVEELRNELVTLAKPMPAPSERYERPRLRRYRTGSYTYLPRNLRRQVHEIRNIRHGRG